MKCSRYRVFTVVNKIDTSLGDFFLSRDGEVDYGDLPSKFDMARLLNAIRVGQEVYTEFICDEEYDNE